MNNKIEIFEKNTQNIAVYVGGITDLGMYVPYLTVKKKTSDAVPILSKAGIVSDPSTTYMFELTSEDTSINVGDYVYDITLEQGTIKHTIIKDVFSIIDTVRL